MDKIKSKSIKKSFVIYMTTCILTALALSLLLSCACQAGQNYLNDKYLYGDISGNAVQIISEYESPYYKFTPSEKFIYEFLGLASIGIPIFSFIAAIIVTSVLFYKKNLQQPLVILNDAAEKIAENDLSFKIVYDKEDELGKLCSSFEKMRIALYENNAEMWWQVEERKRLNAAFAHDLRTPLTVLKGQSEMIAEYAPKMSNDKIISTAEMMKRHIIRLETYVNTMNDLQRLEDVEIKRGSIPAEDY